MWHILENTLMTEKSKSILFNYLKHLIRRDLPGIWTGGSNYSSDAVLCIGGEKKVYSSLW